MALESVTTRLRQHYYVKVADYSLMQTKTLPKLPLDQISLNGAFYIFAGDGHPKTWMTKVVSCCQHRQMLAANPASVAKYLFELGRLQQPQLSGKAPVAARTPGTTGRLLQISAIRLKGGHGPWRGAP